MAISRNRLLPAALLLTMAALLSPQAYAQTTTWEFTTMADSSAELAFFSIPAVNDAGQIAFVATFDDGASGQAVYRRESNGILTVIADTSGPIASFSGDPSLNASGLVTFAATLDSGSRSVLCGNGGALLTIANTVADGLTSIDSKPFISDTGGVVVVRAVRSADGARVILSGDGNAAPTSLLDSTGTYDPVDVAGINGSGVVAFEALDGTGAKGVYRRTQAGVVTPIAVLSAGGFTSVEALDINNNGTVVFSTDTAANVADLSVDTTGTPVSFASTQGTPFVSFGPAAVAESGAVAFRGAFAGGLDGIFAGGTGLYEKAIALGDTLAGSAVTALDTGPQANANSGPFVFRAGRSHGPTGIYLAIPNFSDGGGGGGGALDPASIALLLFASGLSLRTRRVRVAGGRFGR